MKTIEEIMKVTECNSELAEKLYNELIKLPEKLGEFMSDHLDVVNAYNADDIEVMRLCDYSRDGSGIITVTRVDEEFPTDLDGIPNYNRWKYCFNCLFDEIEESVELY